jgi:polar amino acid transport system permease protein
MSGISWDWHYTGKFVPDLVIALFQYTIVVTVLAFVLALVAGLVLALLTRTRNVVVRQVVRWVMEFVRSTPPLVQLFFVFYVLPQLGLTLDAVTCGVLTLGIHYATYTSEVYRAGIEDVPRGQWEAATALSLSTRRTWTSVILPQAIPKVIPAQGNNLISLLKDVPILVSIAVPELLFQAFSAGNQTLSYLEPLTVAGVLFLAVSIPASILVRRLERRFGH